MFPSATPNPICVTEALLLVDVTKRMGLLLSLTSFQLWGYDFTPTWATRISPPLYSTRVQPKRLGFPYHSQLQLPLWRIYPSLCRPRILGLLSLPLLSFCLYDLGSTWERQAENTTGYTWPSPSQIPLLR